MKRDDADGNVSERLTGERDLLLDLVEEPDVIWGDTAPPGQGMTTPVEPYLGADGKWKLLDTLDWPDRPMFQ